jgi:hypothetical protein
MALSRNQNRSEVAICGSFCLADAGRGPHRHANTAEVTQSSVARGRPPRRWQKRCRRQASIFALSVAQTQERGVVEAHLAQPHVEALRHYIAVPAAWLNPLPRLAFTETSFSVGGPGRLIVLVSPRVHRLDELTAVDAASCRSGCNSSGTSSRRYEDFKSLLRPPPAASLCQNYDRPQFASTCGALLSVDAIVTARTAPILVFLLPKIERHGPIPVLRRTAASRLIYA